MDWFISIVAAVLLFLAWILIVRSFPDILSKGIVKRIEHKYDSKLEDFKGEIEASNSALKASVDFLSASQSELRAKRISSVENLWLAIEAWSAAYGSGVVVLTLMTPDELDSCVAGRSRSHTRLALETYKELDFFKKQSDKVRDELLEGYEILYVGSRLWMIYRTIVSVHGRVGFLIGDSLKDRKYHDWRNDNLMNFHLRKVLPNDTLEMGKDKRLGGLKDAFDWLKAEFVKESIDFLQGSGAFANSVSEIHSILRDEVADRYRSEEV